MSFVFYDTETTGIHTAFDQILQFAAIRTDPDLNELERFEIRCQLLPHVVPAPGAMRVTGIRATQLTDKNLPSHYEMMCAIRQKMLEWSPSTFLGYNTIDFDEHLLRNAYYKTLHPPYLTNTSGNARSDILRAAQASSIHSPGALVIPAGAGNKPSFKLDSLAPANGFAHENAHDALADVEATIFIARLLSERCPDVWSSFMRFSTKAAVIDYVSNEQIFCLSEFYFGKPYSWLVMPLGASADDPLALYVFDLGVDPDSFSKAGT
jgi:exodeoxyribonuclease-1